MGKLFSTEPAAVIGASMAALAMLVTFGVNIMPEQQEGIQKFLTALLPLAGAFWIRSQVIPTAKVESAHGATGAQAAADVTKADLRADDAVTRNKLLTFLLAIGLSVSLSACGAKQIGVAVDADDQITSRLTRIDRDGDRLTGCLPLPPKGTEAPEPAQPETCVAFNRVMQSTAAAAKTFNRSVRNQDPIAALSLIRELTAVGDAVAKAVPVTKEFIAERLRLLEEIRDLIRLASSALGGGK